MSIKNKAKNNIKMRKMNIGQLPEKRPFLTIFGCFGGVLMVFKN